MSVESGGSLSIGAPSDLAKIWSDALENYQLHSGKSVRDLPQPENMSEIVAFAAQQKKGFGKERHPTDQIDILRTYLSKHLDYIDTAAVFIKEATTGIFPPSKAIYTAISYMLKKAKSVTTALNLIAKSFEEMNTVLERINFLDESRLPNIPGYRLCIGRVFYSLMAIFGISTRFLKGGRAVAWLKKMVTNDDDELQKAYDHMIKAIQALDPATNMATLRKVGDVEVRLIETQGHIETSRLDMKAGFAASEAQGQLLAHQSAEVLNAITQLQREMSETFSRSSRLTMESRGALGKDPGASKDVAARKKVALNKTRKFFANPTDPSIQFKDIELSYVQNTACWFESESEYDTWLRLDSQILVISAEDGAGKSFLAYSLIEVLKRHIKGRFRTSAAYFFFREQQDALRSLKNALCAMVTQIAENDDKYCEQVASELGEYSFNNSSATCQDLEVNRIWHDFFIKKFTVEQLVPHEPDSSNEREKVQENNNRTNGSSSIAPQGSKDETTATYKKPESSEEQRGALVYLIFDGLDEMAVADRHKLISCLRSLKEKRINIKVLLTCRSSLYRESQISLVEPELLPLNPEQRSADLSRLVKMRCDTLHRLRKFRADTKWRIAACLHQMEEENSIGMLYADRALQYLNSVGREGAVLKALGNLPPDVQTLYAKILADCSARRSAGQGKALKLFYASVAFSKRPLNLQESRAFMSLNFQGGTFHVDDEIRDRSASILELSRSLRHDFEGASKLENIEEFPDNFAEAGEAFEDDVDDKLPLVFQERSLREFFRTTDTQSGELKLDSSATSIYFFLTSIEALCGTNNDSIEVRKDFEAYAASAWLQHFFDISLGLVGDREFILVFEALRRILSNANDAASVIERTTHECYSQFDVRQVKQERLSHTLASWAERALKLPDGDLSVDTRSWATELASNPADAALPLARAHVLSWYRKLDMWASYQSFRCAWKAGSKTDFLRKQHRNELLKAEPKTAEDIQFLAAAFHDIDQDHNAHRAIGLVLAYHGFYNEASVECEMALDEAGPAQDQFYTWTALGQIYRNLAHAMSFEDGAEKYTEAEEKEYAQAACSYADKALGVYQESELSAVSSYVKWHIQEAWIIRASAERKLGNAETAIKAYEQSLTLGIRLKGSLLQQITAIFYERKQMQDLLSKVETWSALDRSYWLALYDPGEEQNNSDVNQMFQCAAKESGKLEFMIATYEELIQILDHNNNAAILRYHLASAHLRVLGNIQDAKGLLNQVLDGESCKNPVTGADSENTLFAARNDLSDIIYEQFRTATNYESKAALLKELTEIPNKQLATISADYFLSESQCAMIMARMARKLGPTNLYQEVMERAFKTCVDALLDLRGSNDQVSFLQLAKALGTMGGLERDARIAYSAQFSIVDPSVGHGWGMYEINDDGDESVANLEGDTVEGEEEATKSSEQDLNNSKIDAPELNGNKDTDDNDRVDKDNADKDSADKNNADKACADKDCADKDSIDKIRADKNNADKASADKDCADKDSIDKVSADKDSIDKVSADKDSVDKDSVGKDSTDKDSNDKDSIDKVSIDKVSVSSTTSEEGEEGPNRTPIENTTISSTNTTPPPPPSATAAAAMEDEPEELASEAELWCDGECNQREPVQDWTSQPKKFYGCLICANCDLCEACYGKRMAYNRGEPSTYWKTYCGPNHEYILGPIEGWKGVRKGIMTIGDEEILFKRWIEGLQLRWREKWVEFWAG